VPVLNKGWLGVTEQTESKWHKKWRFWPRISPLPPAFTGGLQMLLILGNSLGTVSGMKAVITQAGRQPVEIKRGNVTGTSHANLD
jgi:hypothetical protein